MRFDSGFCESVSMHALLCSGSSVSSTRCCFGRTRASHTFCRLYGLHRGRSGYWNAVSEPSCPPRPSDTGTRITTSSSSSFTVALILDIANATLRR